MKEANQLPDEVTGLIEQFLRDMGVITAQCSDSSIGCSPRLEHRHVVWMNQGHPFQGPDQRLAQQDGVRAAGKFSACYLLFFLNPPLLHYSYLMFMLGILVRYF